MTLIKFQYYPPYGSALPGLQYNYADDGDTSKYRFGFNNQEQDSELGEYYAFEYRIHDVRLGRFLSVDPLSEEYPWNSTYAFGENCVIRFIDLEGKEKADPYQFFIARNILDGYLTNIQTGVINDILIFNRVKLSQVIQLLKIDLNSNNFNPSKIGNFDSYEKSGGFFCGPAAVSSVIMNYNPVGYINAVLSLMLNGFYINEKTGVKIILPEFIKNIECNVGGYAGFENIPIYDVVFAMSIRSNENENSDKNLKSKYSAGTLPWEIDDLLGVMGISLQSQSIYGGQSLQDINNIIMAVSKGIMPIIFENHLLTTDQKESKLGIHYIVITEFKFTENGDISFSYLSGGKIASNVLSISKFLSGMKAYYIPTFDDIQIIKQQPRLNNGSGIGLMEQSEFDFDLNSK